MSNKGHTDPGSARQAKPWEALKVSRATYYRMTEEQRQLKFEVVSSETGNIDLDKLREAYRSEIRSQLEREYKLKLANREATLERMLRDLRQREARGNPLDNNEWLFLLKFFHPDTANHEHSEQDMHAAMIIWNGKRNLLVNAKPKKTSRK